MAGMSALEVECSCSEGSGDMEALYFGAAWRTSVAQGEEHKSCSGQAPKISPDIPWLLSSLRSAA